MSPCVVDLDNAELYRKWSEETIEHWWVDDRERLMLGDAQCLWVSGGESVGGRLAGWVKEAFMDRRWKICGCVSWSVDGRTHGGWAGGRTDDGQLQRQ